MFADADTDAEEAVDDTQCVQSAGLDKPISATVCCLAADPATCEEPACLDAVPDPVTADTDCGGANLCLGARGECEVRKAAIDLGVSASTLAGGILVIIIIAAAAGVAFLIWVIKKCCCNNEQPSAPPTTSKEDAREQLEGELQDVRKQQEDLEKGAP